MRIRTMLITGTATGALALAFVQPASAAAASPGTVSHAASGCAQMIVVTPHAGTTVSAASMGMPADTAGFYAQAAAQHSTWLTDLHCTSTGLTHPFTLPHSATTPATTGLTNNLVSTNWSGYQINQTAQLVQAGWTVPTVTKPVPAYSNTGYYSSTWTGIGGGFNAGTPLIQAGTEQEVADNGTTTYYFWYEIVATGNNNGEQRISMPVHPGDAVGAVSLWTAATGAEMGVCNFSTTNTCVQFYVPSPAPGTSEEWIEEAPSLGHTILPLANFHTVHFTNGCWAPTWYTGAPCNTITSGGPQAISLQQYVLGSYQTLALPGRMDANGLGFSDSYYAPVRPDPCPTC